MVSTYLLNHIVAALKNSFDFVAVCDVVKENMEDKIAKFELPQSTKKYTDYREILRREKPELVAITTESGKHAQIALDCIKAECNCIIEKQIALSLADVDTIIEAIECKGVKVCTCNQNRFNKFVRQIWKSVEKYCLGWLFYRTTHIRYPYL